jgi:hypothetical protein
VSAIRGGGALFGCVFLLSNPRSVTKLFNESFKPFSTLSTLGRTKRVSAGTSSLNSSQQIATRLTRVSRRWLQTQLHDPTYGRLRDPTSFQNSVVFFRVSQA